MAFWAVLDEGVLRRRIGGAKVMHDQLVHLADIAERATVSPRKGRCRRRRRWRP
jgi:hypothetical protein